MIIEDTQSRILRLLSSAERHIQNAFIQSISDIRKEIKLSELADLIESGDIQTALNMLSESTTLTGQHVSVASVESFNDAGESATQFISNSLERQISFDMANPRAVGMLRNAEFKIVEVYRYEQMEAIRSALIDGMRRQLNPRAQAIRVRDSIGLTAHQSRAVTNFRNILETNPIEAFSRKLRDRRFDRTLIRIDEQGGTLTEMQIDRMVGRYHDRYVKYRSEVIARTEALRAVNEANNEAFAQAVENGELQRNEIERKWDSSLDDRVRDSHSEMHGQTVGIGEPFISGLGNALMYPGDPGAPAEDIIQCRCVVTTRINTNG